MFTIMAVFTLVVIVDLFLLFPQEKRGDSIFPPYMAELFLCSKCQDIFQNKKIKANLFPDSSTPPRRSRNEPFSPAFVMVIFHLSHCKKHKFSSTKR